MIRWILKGLLRDKTRSLFPFLVVTVGVTLMIYLIGFMEGVFMGLINTTANLDTGHLRFVNKPFYDEEHLNPMDRALGAQRETKDWLEKYSDPRVKWTPRIRWAAILDVPDSEGNTLHQTPITGMALNLLDENSIEIERLDLKSSITEGRLPTKTHQMLVGYKLAKSLKLKLGDTLTLLGQTFDGGLATDNYKVSGFIRFGVAAMDKKMAIIDIKDAQQSFYMEDLVTDWLGFLPGEVSYKEYAFLKAQIDTELESILKNPPKGWAKDDVPIILSILDQRNLFELARKFELIKNIVVGIFSILMIIVLWNAGLLNGIHRYGEVGLLLALGETHKRLVTFMASEALLIGIGGTLTGCFLGGGIVYYLQEVGLSMGTLFEKSGMMLNDVVRARLSWKAFLFGIIPGITCSVFGNLIANLAIFKRSEANLFREMEAG